MARRELPFDVVEQILVGLDVKDLIRFKSVCKSWQSLISGSRFVNAHLKLSYAKDRNNPEFGHRRIHICGVRGTCDDRTCYLKNPHVVGSCNGLLCVSPKHVEFVVTNPCTRERKKLPNPPYVPYDNIRTHINTSYVACWGFGYDSSADDYKFIAGFMKWDEKPLNEKRFFFSERMVVFYALTLKSNTCKLIGQLKYEMGFGSRTGILCGGTLHWLKNGSKKKLVEIISLYLSTDEFKEMPLTDTDLVDDCARHDYNLGVMEECLCIHSRCRYLRCYRSTKKWVMKNNKWELYVDDHCQNKYDVAHYLTKTVGEGDVYICDDGTHVPSNWYFVRASIFVKSLVSPHPHPHLKEQGDKRVESGAKGNLGKRKRIKMRKGSFKHKTPLFKRLVGLRFI